MVELKVGDAWVVLTRAALLHVAVPCQEDGFRQSGFRCFAERGGEVEVF